MIDIHFIKDCCYDCNEPDLDMYDDSLDIYDMNTTCSKKKNVHIWCTKCNVCYRYNQEKLENIIKPVQEKMDI